MKNSKKGVSLITLIIIILVMIILATAVILTLRNTNTIGKANEAKFKQNMANYQDELNNYFAEQFLNNQLYTPESLNLSGVSVKTAIPSMSSADTAVFSIVNGKLTVNSNADNDYKTWATQVGVNVAGEVPVESASSSVSPASAPLASAPATSAAATVIDIAAVKAAIAADTAPGYTVIGTTSSAIYTEVSGVWTYVPTTTPLYSSTMTRVAQQYYGRSVNYSANGITDWQLFYIGESGSGDNKEYNVYLISKDYIPYEKLPSYDSTSGAGDMTKGTTNYNAYFDTTKSMKTEILSSNKMIERGYILAEDLETFGLTELSGKYTGESLNNNMKSALYLLDESKWEAFATGTKGEVAYGGPTARMVIDSTNEYWGTDVTASASSKTGYTFSESSSGIWYYWPDRTDSMYTIKSETNALAYWIAGPSARGDNYVLSGTSSSFLGADSSNYDVLRVSRPSFSKL